eukprot:scaffold13221_cov100-Isochrysis_galbana.AAC.1
MQHPHIEAQTSSESLRRAKICTASRTYAVHGACVRPCRSAHGTIYHTIVRVGHNFSNGPNLNCVNQRPSAAMICGLRPKLHRLKPPVMRGQTPDKEERVVGGKTEHAAGDRRPSSERARAGVIHISQD